MSDRSSIPDVEMQEAKAAFEQSLERLDVAAQGLDDQRERIRGTLPPDVRREVFPAEITGRHERVALPEGNKHPYK